MTLNLIHRDILYVAYLTQFSDKLLLNKDAADGDDLVDTTVRTERTHRWSA